MVHTQVFRIPFTFLLVAAICGSLGLSGCEGGSSGSGSPGASGGSSTSGSSFTVPSSISTASFNSEGATTQNDSSIDVSSVAEGYVAATATNASKLKLQVTSGQMSYNYDLPSDGTPLIAPLNMGNGTYTVRVMQNTSGNNYVEINSVTTDVSMSSEFEPFLRPNVYCNYDSSSACVAKARELAQNAENEAAAVEAIYDWIVDNVSYDSAKAAQLSDVTGYVPDPDETLSSGTGICLDYASLGAAMIRSLGIPCKIVTGYVSPDNIYHAWNLIYIDGTWQSAEVNVSANTWERIDMTFAASGSSSYIGDGTTYTDRYTY